MSAACGSPPAASPSGGGAPKSRRSKKQRAAAAAAAAAAHASSAASAAPVAEPEVPLVFQNPGENNRNGINIAMPTVSPEQMSALQQALPGYTQDGGVLVPFSHALLSPSQQQALARSPLAANPPPPPDVLLFVTDGRNQYHSHGQSAWQSATSINNEWLPLRISTTDPSKVTFIQQSALKLGKQSQENLEAVRQTNDRIKKRKELTFALEVNKKEYALAKEHGEVSDVGALAIERDRIEEELAKVEKEDKEVAEQYAQQQLQEQRYGYGYHHQQQLQPKPGSPAWGEQVTVQQTIDLPFGYCRMSDYEGDPNARVYNIVKVQQISIRALPKKQAVTIITLPQ